MNERDLVRLKHMRDESVQALKFIEGQSRKDLDESRLLLYGVLHALQIVGEAASPVTAETRSAHPEIRWKDIIGMRQWLVHSYERVQNEIIWKTVTEDLAPLIDALNALIK